jgi:hypothetical protein
MVVPILRHEILVLGKVKEIALQVEPKAPGRPGALIPLD